MCFYVFIYICMCDGHVIKDYITYLILPNYISSNIAGHNFLTTSVMNVSRERKRSLMLTEKPTEIKLSTSILNCYNTINGRHSTTTHNQTIIHTNPTSSEDTPESDKEMRISLSSTASDEVVVWWSSVWSSTDLNGAQPQPHRPYTHSQPHRPCTQPQPHWP